MSINTQEITAINEVVNKAAYVGIFIEVAHLLNSRWMTASREQRDATKGITKDITLEERYETECNEIEAFTLVNIPSLDELRRQLVHAAQTTKIRVLYEGVQFAGTLDQVFEFARGINEHHYEKVSARLISKDAEMPEVLVTSFKPRTCTRIITFKGLIGAGQGYPYEIELYDTAQFTEGYSKLASLGGEGTLQWTVTSNEGFSGETLGRLTAIMTSLS